MLTADDTLRSCVAQETEQFILMDAVPQQAYGRMRMCRAMVNDHFTPAYLAAMTSAMAAFADGYPEVRQPQSQAAPAAHVPEAAACCEPDSASAPVPLPGSDIPAASAGSDVMERSRRGRPRIAVPGTAKPRPPIANAQIHAKDA